jgi:hypothetical protein
MKVMIEICYEDATKNKTTELEIKGEPKGLRLMNAIEKAVEKAFKDDKDWTRWNLLG